MFRNPNRLPQLNATEAPINSIPCPPAQVGGIPNGRRFSHEDAAGNLRFDVTETQSGHVEVCVPWTPRTAICRKIHLGAKSTLEELESNATLRGGAGCDLLIRSMGESTTRTITAALTFIPGNSPQDKQVSIFVLHAEIAIGTQPVGQIIDEITRCFLDRYKRDKNAGGYHIRHICDDYLAEVTAHLLGGVATHPPSLPWPR